MSNGGTESYVFNLAAALKKHECNVLILTPFINLNNYEYKGIQVFTFINNDFHNFKERVAELHPKIIHFHSLNKTITTKYVEIIFREFGIQPFVSLHLYNTICLRNGEFLFRGIKNCNGEVTPAKCYLCISNENLLKKLVKTILLSIKYDNNLYGLSSYYEKHSEINNLKKFARLISFNNQQKRILSQNGISSSVIPHAIEKSYFGLKNKIDSNKITLGYAGRLSEEKGLHVLVEALGNINHRSFRLLILGIVNSEYELYLGRVMQRCVQLGIDVDFKLNLPKSKYEYHFSEISILCVPSLIFEVGPIVVLESLSKNIPVLASQFSSNYIRNGIDGFIYNDFKSLVNILMHISSNDLFFEKLNFTDTNVLTYNDVALIHRNLYFN